MEYLINDVREFMASVTVYKLATDQNAQTRFMEYFNYAFDMLPPCMACPGDLEAAIIKMHWILKKHSDKHYKLTKAMALTKYTMKPHTRVYSYALNMMITPMNCTDAMAEALMAENPKHAQLFVINNGFEVPVENVVVSKKISIGKKELEATNDVPDPEPIVKMAAKTDKPVTPKPGKKKAKKAKK